MITEVFDLNPELVDKLTIIWRNSVLATHTFLSTEEVDQIQHYLPEGLKSVNHLLVFGDGKKITAFMGIAGQKIEMLFVDESARGQGIGKQLINYGIKNFHINSLSVNEQNPQAVGFYQYMGFVVTETSPLDDQGNPYPILKMKLK